MLRNRLIYLAALLGGVVFYGFFYVWFSWYLLVLLLCLPWFSLLLSLPAAADVAAGEGPPERTGRAPAPNGMPPAAAHVPVHPPNP